MGSLSLLQQIFPTKESNWGLLNCRWILYQLNYQESQVIKDLPANAGDVRDVGAIPGLERFPKEENDNPLKYTCMNNPMDKGVW